MRSKAAKYESTSDSLKAGTKEMHLLTSNGIAAMKVEPGVSGEAEGTQVWASSSSLRSLIALSASISSLLISSSIWALLSWAFSSASIWRRANRTFNRAPSWLSELTEDSGL
ncbi:hypothetical protein XENOCAPTIV_027884 [Xenoophorus captivus]|uniref:Uncharacterized protein n=1 Tax=Xenoophorus captivus TaxID=1517983 RepID=A0ABV0QTR7_9TELE